MSSLWRTHGDAAAEHLAVADWVVQAALQLGLIPGGLRVRSANTVTAILSNGGKVGISLVVYPDRYLPASATPFTVVRASTRSVHRLFGTAINLG